MACEAEEAEQVGGGHAAPKGAFSAAAESEGASDMDAISRSKYLLTLAYKDLGAAHALGPHDLLMEAGVTTPPPSHR